MNLSSYLTNSNVGAFIFILCAFILVGCQSEQTAEKEATDETIPVKLVLVTMFETGEDEGDQAGEFQLWKERQNLSVRIPFPQSHHDLFYNPDTQVLGMVTGIGTAKSATATMALGLSLIHI